MLLRVNNLSAKVPEKNKIILKNIFLEIKEGSIHLLIGPNGSGKSSLAKAIMGLSGIEVISGQVLVKEKDITYWPVEKRAQTGLVLAFQEPAYFDGVKVKDFLEISFKDKKNEKELKKILKLVGLNSEFLNREMSHELSGGERKRIELASVILMKPRLIILDEPDSGLDIIIYHELANILQNIKKETKASILLITHREELGFLANKASFLFHGQILAQGGFREVMRKYCQTVNRKRVCQQCSKNL